MNLDEKNEIGSVEVAETSDASDPPRYGSREEETAFLQTRTRRVFSPKQLFAFSIMYMGTWGAILGNMYYGIENGGPAAWFFGYIIIMSGALLQTAAFAELSSIMPIAGAQYYWTYYFATPSTRRFLTWIQGWVTWTAYIALMASGNSYTTAILEGLIQLNFPEYEIKGWRTTLISLGVVAIPTLVNLYAFRTVPWFEFIAGVLNVVLFVVHVVIFWAMAPRNGPETFRETNVSSGWDSYFISVHKGALSSIWLFIGFESVIHMGEETKRPKRTVPSILLGSISTGMVMGLVMIVTAMFHMPSVETLLGGHNPQVTTVLYASGSKEVTTALTGVTVFMSIACYMTAVTSVSRITWAWARDGGLPSYFGYVDGKYRIPFRAVLLSSVLVGLLTLLNIRSETYVALGAITSLASMAMYLSYAIVLLVVIHARVTTGVTLGEWNLGKWGLWIDIAALCFTVYTLIWFPVPQNMPVNEQTMNYSGPVLLAVLIGAVGLWYVRAKVRWGGPNQRVVDMILNSDG